MRVLTLTWEFPPLFTGGLGMACYGIVKALLRLGIEVDLIIPTKEEVYFPLRKEEDADSLPLSFPDPGKRKKRGGKITIKEILEEGAIVGAYYTTGERVWERIWERIWEEEPLEAYRKSSSLDNLRQLLSGDHFLFQEVRRYTTLAFGIAKQLDFDVIHAHDWLTYPAGILLKEFSGKPLAVHMHATEFDRAGGPGAEGIHHIEYLGISLADRVIAVSGYTANMLAERYRADKRKIRVAHNAFALSGKEKEKKRLFKEITILFLGRITIQKGPDYFLEVARRVLEKEKNVRFIVGGIGDMQRQMLHRSASFAPGTKILFAGFLKREEVEEILRAADIFVMPSVSEPFGIVTLEAMSYGAVAIVSRQSGIVEVVKNVYKVDFWDIDRIVSIILELVSKPEKLREVSRKSVEEAKKFQWEETARKIADVYKEIKER
ncbi:glycosyltransferase family 1 protein [candidate division NPL-UPA2 bacterium Unc8]|uniref:Glycosyltransferase family 1 protein n=1 Tax=candidate division NPL-UPA2 bacterium Unc8 TaxID=1980939 RepID=A0A399FUN4_UNCN2|nr:Glycogen synthase [Bacillota bacterium]MBT9146654.1 Glycogen synthase [Bacillota bacterium]RIH99616.1 MAG: glycosyltransferase family 1 protein [candidate division NPL-UPA2 bacterium Unc8]